MPPAPPTGEEGLSPDSESLRLARMLQAEDVRLPFASQRAPQEAYYAEQQEGAERLAALDAERRAVSGS